MSLGEFLDGSREWVREFVRPFTTKGQELWVVFPDGKVRFCALLFCGRRMNGVFVL